jgi:hypothetical protein
VTAPPGGQPYRSPNRIRIRHGRHAERCLTPVKRVEVGRARCYGVPSGGRFYITANPADCRTFIWDATMSQRPLSCPLGQAGWPTAIVLRRRRQFAAERRHMLTRTTGSGRSWKSLISPISSAFCPWSDPARARMRRST